MDETERNKTVARRFHDEIIVGQQYEKVTDFLCEDIVHARGAIGDTLTTIDPIGVASLKALSGPIRFVAATKLLRQRFPKWDSQLLEILGEGNRVVTRCVVHGRDEGGFLGTGPEGGAEFALDQVVLHEFRDGKICRIFAISDQLTFWRALGARLPGDGDAISRR